jgi:hypothetical protein
MPNPSKSPISFARINTLHFSLFSGDEFSTGLRMRKGPWLGCGARPNNVVTLT